jgi:hypothetical protein
MTDTASPSPAHRLVALAILAIAVLVSGTALAGESSASNQKATLPGVSGDYHIAKPAPGPEPDDATSGDGDGTFKIGDTEVRISGTITMDVGAGSTGLPRH